MALVVLGMLAGLVSERLGPFPLGVDPEHRVRVVATYREIVGEQRPDFAKTLESWTVEDERGALLFRESTPAGDAGWSVWLSAALVTGPRPFLLIRLEALPSAPSEGTTYLVFGFDRRDRFRRMGKFVKRGAGLRNPSDGTGRIALVNGRYLELGVWLHYFGLTFRYAYDETQQEFVLQNRCGPAEDVSVDRQPAEHAGPARRTITLFARPEKGTRLKQITLVYPVALTVSEACVEVPPESTGAPPRGQWLRVKINGDEGWVSEPEFDRLGLVGSG